MRVIRRPARENMIEAALLSKSGVPSVQLIIYINEVGRSLVFRGVFHGPVVENEDGSWVATGEYRWTDGDTEGHQSYILTVLADGSAILELGETVETPILTS